MELNVVLYFGPGLFRTILIIVAVYFIIRFIRKVVLPIFNNQQNTQGNFRQQHRRPEGDVTIERNRRKGSHIDKDEGEYVDFEEID